MTRIGGLTADVHIDNQRHAERQGIDYSIYYHITHTHTLKIEEAGSLPSRERSHIPPMEEENHRAPATFKGDMWSSCGPTMLGPKEINYIPKWWVLHVETSWNPNGSIVVVEGQSDLNQSFVGDRRYELMLTCRVSIHKMRMITISNDDNNRFLFLWTCQPCQNMKTTVMIMTTGLPWWQWWRHQQRGQS